MTLAVVGMLNANTTTTTIHIYFQYGHPLFSANSRKLYKLFCLTSFYFNRFFVQNFRVNAKLFGCQKIMNFYIILLSGSYEATACPLGTYSNVTGAVNKYVCTDCDEGYYCNCVAGLAPAGKCDAGYYCTGGAKVSTQHATEPGNMQIMKS